MSLFSPLFIHDGDNGNMPIPALPILTVQIAEHSFENGRITIGPHLMSAQGIDEFVETIIADAEALRRLAKHELEIALSRAKP